MTAHDSGRDQPYITVEALKAEEDRELLRAARTGDRFGHVAPVPKMMGMLTAVGMLACLPSPIGFVSDENVGGAAGSRSASSGGASTGGAGTGATHEGMAGVAGTGAGGSSNTGGMPALPEAMALWFMADLGIAVDGDAVQRWDDQSTWAHHATQSNAARRPKLVKSSSSLPMVEFDGIDDYLRLPWGFEVFEGASFFVVAEAFPNAGCAGILSFANLTYPYDDVEFGRHTQNLLYYEALDEYVEGEVDGFEAGRKLQASIVQDLDGHVELRIDRRLTGSDTIRLPNEVVREENFVGKNTYNACPTSFYGRIGEILLYTRGLSAEERDQIEQYLEDKWEL